ncbi:type VI secretion system tube protein Hcp [Solirubrobacter ginsenosidimutans]|uniref:Type VI secretion system tube protein Hcp n=1 Tax=Solirubrobacter ginsenosidimutans TaxID=490573 RepID=A0A9X3MNL3_9ACTN|nr:type VI secretion system tube protein Hcp [Solirubrobacter ginsenosidimutans]MDA0159549.1 type VI secretion system tube protein Hcp [Solirubrobacter ginsenosidimutans]
MPQLSTRRRLARRVALVAVPLMLAIGATNAIADPGPPLQADSNTTTIPGQAGTTPVFLKLDGIPGESADPSHPGEIDVKSFAFGAKNSSTEGGPGKVTFSSISFTKAYDKSSPLLLQHVATGQRIPQATFSFRRSGRNGDGFLVYKFQDLGVGEYQQGGDTGVSPLLEHVVLDFAKVQVSYLPVAGPPLVTAGWDVRLNAPL